MFANCFLLFNRHGSLEFRSERDLSTMSGPGVELPDFCPTFRLGIPGCFREGTRQ